MAPDRRPTSLQTGYVDRSPALLGGVRRAINEVVDSLHADGTLAGLSEQYFGRDYAAAAAQFDMSSIGQTVE